MTAPEPLVLRSTANPTVKRLVRLRDNRTRRRSQRVIVDGWRETARALEAGLRLCGLFVPNDEVESSIDTDVRHAVIDAAKNDNVLQLVSSAVMEKISYGQSPREVVAEFVEPAKGIEQLQLPETPLILVLDGIEKPGNVGAVFRCADASGVDAVIVTGEGGDFFNPNAIRSSLGAVFTVPAAMATQTEAASFLQRRQIRPLAARVESSQPLWSANLSGPLAIILGSESAGLGERWQVLDGKPIEGVRIPMAGRIDSLNIAVSAAVIVFEAIRVRKQARKA